MNLPPPPPPTAAPGCAPNPCGNPADNRGSVNPDMQRMGADFERQLQQYSDASGPSNDECADVPSGGGQDSAANASRSETSTADAVHGKYGEGDSGGEERGSANTQGDASRRALFRDGATPSDNGDGPQARMLSARGTQDGNPGTAGQTLVGQPSVNDGCATTGDAKATAGAGDTSATPDTPAPNGPPKGDSTTGQRKLTGDTKKPEGMADKLANANGLRAGGQTGQAGQAGGAAGGTGARSLTLRMPTQQGEPSTEALAGLLGTGTTALAGLPQMPGDGQAVGALMGRGGRGKGGATGGPDDEGSDRLGEMMGGGAQLQGSGPQAQPSAAGLLPSDPSKTQAALETALRNAAAPTTDSTKAGTYEVSLPTSAGTLELKATRAQPVNGNNNGTAWTLDIRAARGDAAALARNRFRLADRLQARAVSSHVRIEGNDSDDGQESQ